MNTFFISDTPITDVFDYDESGCLRWKISPVGWIKIGDIAGSARKDGYVEVKCKGIRYLVHRLIFALHHGYMPDLVDHIDRNPSNNRIENLRESDKSRNGFNRGAQANSKTGVKGVSICKSTGKYIVRYKHSGKNLFGGTFDCLHDAMFKRRIMEIKYGGED